MNFSTDLISGTAPLTVHFNDFSTGSLTGWAWYFGDENYSAPWTLVNASSGWSARYDHSSSVLPDGDIVLFAGFDGGVYLNNDTWRSTDDGATWTLMTPNANWTKRTYPSTVALPDGSIVMMGGYDNNGDQHAIKNDTWRSTDNGATWTLMNASSGWSARESPSTVALSDGSIVLMGGAWGDRKNDTWRSTDNGATWTLMNASSGWMGRYSHTGVAMPDGSIVLMGGESGVGYTYQNDTWRSTDKGATWTLMNASSGWSARFTHTSAALPDGSILLMGGMGIIGPQGLNDVWRSTDNGATWSQVTANAAWEPRGRHTSVALPDGSIVLMGGSGLIGTHSIGNDTWRLNPVGSSVQNPVHTYTQPGIYQVALQAYNAGGYNSTRKTGYITVTGSSAPVANFTANITRGFAPFAVQFTDTSTGISITNRTWNFGDGNITSYTESTNPNHIYRNPGVYSVNLTVSNSGGTNSLLRARYITANLTTHVGVFRTSNGNWYTDTTKTGVVNKSFHFGTTGDMPVVGDWDGEGISNTGVFRPANGNWFFDTTRTGVVNATFHFGTTGDIPVIGDWDGNGISDIGIYRPANGNWYLDTTKTGLVNKTFHFGTIGDIPVIGDWDGNAISDIGVFRPSNGNWYLDTTKNGVVNKTFHFGTIGDIPVIGDWDGNGISDAGVFRPANGNWFFDTTKTGVVNTTFHFGTTGDIPVVGDWDGNAISDAGVFRPANGNWFLVYSDEVGAMNLVRTGEPDSRSFVGSAGTKTFHFGSINDTPVMAQSKGAFAVSGKSDA